MLRQSKFDASAKGRKPLTRTSSSTRQSTERATRWRKVPIVATWQRDLLDFALEHAQGRDGRLFLPRTKFGHPKQKGRGGQDLALRC